MTRRQQFAVLIPAGLAAVLWASAAAAGAPDARDWLGRQGYAEPTGIQIVACHGYGCAMRADIPIEGPWLARAAALLRASHGSAAVERRALAEVVRLYMAHLTASFGGRPDEPRSPPSLSGVAGQMDCLDVTANVTSLFLVLEERGLLARHRVESPQSRGFFFDGRWPHYTAVLSESDGRRWAVDPWSRPGERPDVLPLEEWSAEGGD
jgi:hypothetical protein